MTRDYSVIEELMAIDALGGLDDDDRATLERERAAHGPDRAECAAFDRGVRRDGGAARLRAGAGAGRRRHARTHPRDASTDPGDVPGRRRSARRRGGPSRRAPPSGAPVRGLGKRWWRRPRWWRCWPWRSPRSFPPTTGVNEALPAHRIVTFSGDSDGTMAMAYTPGEPGAVLGKRVARPGARHGVRDLDDRGRSAGLGRVRRTDRRSRRGEGGRRHRHHRTMAVTEEPSTAPLHRPRHRSCSPT